MRCSVFTIHGRQKPADGKAMLLESLYFMSSQALLDG